MQQALSLPDTPSLCRRSTTLTDMGIAYAQPTHKQEDIQKACQLACQALFVTKQTKSRAVLERIRIVYAKLEAWKETNEVRALEEQLDGTSALITL